MPVPGPPASVLSAILVTNPNDPSSPLRVAGFSQSGQAPVLPCLLNDVVAMPEDALLDANGTWTGFLSTTGLPGATAPSRYVGATAGGAPTSGTFQVGDWVIDRGGLAWVCTIAGSPGTWNTPTGAPSGGAGGDLAGTFPNPVVARVTGLLPSGNTTTDTATLQNLINAGAKTITLGAAAWTVNTLTPKSGIRITGQGYAATTVQAAAGQALFSMDPGTQLDNVEIDHLTLIAAAAQPIFSGMYLTRSEVHDCYLQAAAADNTSSIWYSTGGNAYMAECRFYRNRQSVGGTARTRPAWYLAANNATVFFQVNDNRWYDNVNFNNDKDTAQFFYQIVYASTQPAATNNGNVFRDEVFEFPTGGMYWLDSASDTVFDHPINEDIAANPVGANPMIKVTQNAAGGPSVANVIRRYTRRGGSAAITDIQLAASCAQTFIDMPARPAGGSSLVIDLGSSTGAYLARLPATSITVLNAAGRTPARAAFSPAAPAATTSTTLVMMGLGSTVTLTPQSSGQVQVVIAGVASVATAVSRLSVAARYGTGAAPANGAAGTGTAIGGGTLTLSPPSTTAGVPFTFTDLLTLTPGTAYWFDLALLTFTAADAAGAGNISFTFTEQQ